MQLEPQMQPEVYYDVDLQPRYHRQRVTKYDSDSEPEYDLCMQEDNKVHLSCLENESSIWGITCLDCKTVFIKHNLSSTDIRCGILFLSNINPETIEASPAGFPYSKKEDIVHIGCFKSITDGHWGCYDCADKLKVFAERLQWKSPQNFIKKFNPFSCSTNSDSIDTQNYSTHHHNKKTPIAKQTTTCLIS